MTRRKHGPKKRKAIPMLDPAGIGERVRKARKARGWRQVDLAEVCGVHKSLIAAVETGIRVPRIRSGVALCFALKRSLEWLYFGSPRRGAFWRYIEAGSSAIDPAPGVSPCARRPGRQSRRLKAEC